MNAFPLRDRRILCVEDEYYLATELERDLQAAGAIVVGPLPSVAAALSRIAGESRIDAAVLDVNLGGEMGYPVVEACLARGIPTVLTTGYSDGDLDRRFPAVPRCEKPFPFSALLTLLKAAVAA